MKAHRALMTLKVCAFILVSTGVSSYCFGWRPLVIYHDGTVAIKWVRLHDKTFRVNSEQLADYQNVNASLLAVTSGFNPYIGPHAGPGVVAGTKGALFVVTWMENPKSEGTYKYSDRFVPFNSIISIDRPLGDSSTDNCVVYYKGPFNRTEWAFIPSGDRRDRLIDKWNYFTFHHVNDTSMKVDEKEAAE